MIRSTPLFAAVLAMGSLVVLGACEGKPQPPTPAKPTGAAPAAEKHDGHDHAAGDKHDDHAGHDHAAGDKHDDHGPEVSLGSSAIGAFQVTAARDGGITPGGEAPVDLTITPATGSAAKVGTVRAWIGTQDAKGSVKAKMDLEKSNYHSHVEVPKPLPEGSKLWVEIEDDKGTKAVGSFDLKK